MMGERARVWQRVSTGGQDEASQLPDLVRWCDSLGYDYDLDESYVVHGKSAYHGKHQAALDTALNDMAAGQYAVLVVWAADRIERRGALAALQLAERARVAGGRIEYVKDAHLNTANEMSDVMLSLSATMARQESARKSQRITAKHNALRAAGSIVGKPAWGYRIELRDGIKVLVPTPEGRKFIPLVYSMAIDGKSLRKIARELDRLGARTEKGGKFNEGSVLQMIQNPVYRGARRDGHKTEDLVSATTWQKANEVMKSRRRAPRGAVVRPKALLAPVCNVCYGKPREGCPSGVSPMYRVNASGYEYYRCTGHGPGRLGCGAPMIPCTELDRYVVAQVSKMSVMHVERTFVPGDDRADQIAALKLQLDKATTRGESNALWDQIEQLESAESVSPHWEEHETELTEGEYFRSLDSGAQREYLSGKKFRAWMKDGHAFANVPPSLAREGIQTAP